MLNEIIYIEKRNLEQEHPSNVFSSASQAELVAFHWGAAIDL